MPIQHHPSVILGTFSPMTNGRSSSNRASLEAKTPPEAEAHPSAWESRGAMHTKIKVQNTSVPRSVAQLEVDLYHSREEIRCLRMTLAEVQEQKVTDLEKELLQATQEIQLLQEETRCAELSSPKIATQTFTTSIVKSGVAAASDQIPSHWPSTPSVQSEVREASHIVCASSPREAQGFMESIRGSSAAELHKRDTFEASCSELSSPEMAVRTFATSIVNSAVAAASDPSRCPSPQSVRSETRRSSPDGRLSFQREDRDSMKYISGRSIRLHHDTSTHLHPGDTFEASRTERESALAAGRAARNSVSLIFAEATRRVEMVNEILRDKRILLKQTAFAVAEKVTRCDLAAAFMMWTAQMKGSRRLRRCSKCLERTGSVVAAKMTRASLAAVWVTWKVLIKGNGIVRRCRDTVTTAFDTLCSSWARLDSVGRLRLCIIAWRNVTSHGWWAQMCGERADLLAQLKRAQNAASEERQRWAEEHRAHKRTQDQLDQALDSTLQGASRAEKASKARENRISQLTGANGWLQLKVGQLENDLSRSRAREGQALLRLDKVLSSQATALQTRSPSKHEGSKAPKPIRESEYIDSTDSIPVLLGRAPFHEEVTRTLTKNSMFPNASSRYSVSGGPRRPKPRGSSSSSSSLQVASSQDCPHPDHGRGGSIRRSGSTGDLTSDFGRHSPHWASGSHGFGQGEQSFLHSGNVDGEVSVDQDKPMAGALRPRQRPSSAGAPRPLSSGSWELGAQSVKRSGDRPESATSRHSEMTKISELSSELEGEVAVDMVATMVDVSSQGAAESLSQSPPSAIPQA